MYIYKFYLEWQISWPPRILTFPPGTSSIWKVLWGKYICPFMISCEISFVNSQCGWKSNRPTISIHAYLVSNFTNIWITLDDMGLAWKSQYITLCRTAFVVDQHGWKLELPYTHSVKLTRVKLKKSLKRFLFGTYSTIHWSSDWGQLFLRDPIE
jgi:hypothetical protein